MSSDSLTNRLRKPKKGSGTLGSNPTMKDLMRATVNQLEQELTQKTKELERAVFFGQSLTESVKELKKRVKKYQTENMKVLEENENLKNVNEVIETKIRDLTYKNKSHVIELDSLREEKEKYCEELKSKHDESLRYLNGNQKLRKDLETKVKIISSMESELEIMKSKSQESMVNSTDILKLRKETSKKISRLESCVRNLEEEKIQLMENSEQTQIRLEKEIQRYISENRKMDGSIKELTKKNRELILDQRKFQKTEIKRTVIDLKNHTRVLKDVKFLVGQCSQDIQDLSTSMFNEFQRKIIQKVKSVQKKNKDHVETLEREKKVLEIKLVRQSPTSSEFTKKVGEIKQELLRKDTEISKLRNNLNDMSEKLMDSEAERDRLKRNAEKTQRYKTHIEEELKLERREKEHLLKENKILKRKYQLQTSELEGMKRKFEETAQKLDELSKSSAKTSSTDIKRMNSKLDRLKQRLEGETELKNRLLKKKEKLEQTIYDLKIRVNKLIDNSIKLEKLKISLKQQLVKRNESLTQSNLKVEQLEKLLSESKLKLLNDFKMEKESLMKKFGSQISNMSEDFEKEKKKLIDHYEKKMTSKIDDDTIRKMSEEMEKMSDMVDCLEIENEEKDKRISILNDKIKYLEESMGKKDMAYARLKNMQGQKYTVTQDNFRKILEEKDRAIRELLDEIDKLRAEMEKQRRQFFLNQEEKLLSSILALRKDINEYKKDDIQNEFQAMEDNIERLKREVQKN